MASFEQNLESLQRTQTIERPQWERKFGDLEKIRTDISEKASPENILNQQKFGQLFRPETERNSERMETQEQFLFDDNGKLCVERGKRVPECEYTINGYQYKTDAQSRITSVSGKLHMKDREGRLPIRNSMQEIGGGDARESDDRGHLVGDQFDGSNGLENLVPMDKELNRGAYLSLEREFAAAKKDGKDVFVDIKVKYNGFSNRPSRFDIRYSLGGETMRRVLKNGG